MKYWSTLTQIETICPFVEFVAPISSTPGLASRPNSVDGHASSNILYDARPDLIANPWYCVWRGLVRLGYDCRCGGVDIRCSPRYGFGCPSSIKNPGPAKDTWTLSRLEFRAELQKKQLVDAERFPGRVRSTERLNKIEMNSDNDSRPDCISYFQRWGMNEEDQPTQLTVSHSI
jgi:hypothetical protein